MKESQTSIINDDSKSKQISATATIRWDVLP